MKAAQAAIAADNDTVSQKLLKIFASLLESLNLSRDVLDSLVTSKSMQ